MRPLERKQKRGSVFLSEEHFQAVEKYAPTCCCAVRCRAVPCCTNSSFIAHDAAIKFLLLLLFFLQFSSSIRDSLKKKEKKKKSLSANPLKVIKKIYFLKGLCVSGTHQRPLHRTVGRSSFFFPRKRRMTEQKKGKKKGGYIQLTAAVISVSIKRAT